MTQNLLSEEVDRHKTLGTKVDRVERRFKTLQSEKLQEIGVADDGLDPVLAQVVLKITRTIDELKSEVKILKR